MTVSLGQAQVPEGLRVYAIGDVHGCLVELSKLLDQIEADVRAFPVAKHQLVFVGDYLDRGRASKGVISRLIALKQSKPDTVFLLGNHDLALLRFLKEPDQVAEDYFALGGAETLRSFGLRVLKDPVGAGQIEELIAYSELTINFSHLNFLAELETSHVIGDYFFSHAGARPGVPLDEQNARDLMWIRDDFLNSAILFEKVIIHGHTARNEVEVRKNRINIDTRCYKTGVLTSVVLEGNSHRFLQT